MKRLAMAVRTDVVLQARNRLYGISVGVSLLIAGVLAKLGTPENMPELFPMMVLLVAGGSTLLYVTGMIVLERADGTLSAVSVSPLKPWEYLAAKVITLTGLALIEGALIVGGGWWWVAREAADVAMPHIVLGVVAMTLLGAVHVLVGIILVVRYKNFMDVLLPMSGIAVLMQLPAFYFIGALDHAAMLLVPTGAPTMLLRAAFTPLQTWEWIYGVVGTLVLLMVLWWWALRAFDVHVTRKAG